MNGNFYRVLRKFDLVDKEGNSHFLNIGDHIYHMDGDTFVEYLGGSDIVYHLEIRQEVCSIPVKRETFISLRESGFLS